jgi:tRNA G18 (ribose-2'-O)-methylase SpoU
MKFIHINNINLPELNIYHQLRDNAFTEDSSFIADSPKVVNLLLQTDITVKSILATQEYYDTYGHLLKEKNISKCFVTDKTLMEEIVGHTLHHNVMMHAVRPEPKSLESIGRHIIMLDEISSTQNIGAIARSAVALGVNSFILPHQGPHPYARRAVRVSMGHIGLMSFHLYNDIVETIKALQTLGYKVYAAEVTEDSTPLSKVNVTDKWVLLMGHEGKGIAKEILDICDEVVTIEMEKGIKSFNVGIAASIMMYQFKHKTD